MGPGEWATDSSRPGRHQAQAWPTAGWSAVRAVVAVVVAGWLVLSVVLVGLFVVCQRHFLPHRRWYGSDVRAMVRLHGARQRLNTARLRSQMRSDAAQLRRQLEQELAAQDQEDC